MMENMANVIIKENKIEQSKKGIIGIKIDENANDLHEKDDNGTFKLYKNDEIIMDKVNEIKEQISNDVNILKEENNSIQRKLDDLDKKI
jgi:hypothetical protein